MSQEKGRGWVGRLWRFTFIFIIANYTCINLLKQAGPLPITWLYESTNAVVVRTYAEKWEYSTPEHGERTAWCPRIEFQYEIDGKEFISNRYQPKVDCGSKLEAESLLTNYPVGSRILVWYSENDPKDAVINKSIQMKVLIFYVGIVFLGLLANFAAFRELIAPNKALQATPKSGAPEL